MDVIYGLLIALILFLIKTFYYNPRIKKRDSVRESLQEHLNKDLMQREEYDKRMKEEKRQIWIPFYIWFKNRTKKKDNS